MCVWGGSFVLFVGDFVVVLFVGWFVFWLTVYYGFISLEMGAAGSLINGLKSCFCQNKTKKRKPSVSTNPFVLTFLKQALFPSEHH